MNAKASVTELDAAVVMKIATSGLDWIHGQREQAREAVITELMKPRFWGTRTQSQAEKIVDDAMAPHCTGYDYEIPRVALTHCLELCKAIIEMGTGKVTLASEDCYWLNQFRNTSPEQHTNE